MRINQHIGSRNLLPRRQAGLNDRLQIGPHSTKTNPRRSEAPRRMSFVPQGERDPQNLEGRAGDVVHVWCCIGSFGLRRAVCLRPAFVSLKVVVGIGPRRRQ